MSSRGSSSSRLTTVPLLQQEDGTFPVTPPEDKESVTQSSTSSDHTMTPPTLQHRRGRRNTNDSTFRPLSIFTKSMLIPFDKNFEKAFDVLKTDSPDRLKIARSILSPEKEQESTTEGEEEDRTDAINPQRRVRPEMSQENRDTGSQQTQPQSHVSETTIATPSRSAPSANMLRQKSVRDWDMDLITALKETSPEKDLNSKVSGDFATLCELPVPDPSEHPAFASQPFKVRTEAPLLFTSTSAADIRAYETRGYKSLEYNSDDCVRSIERKKSLFGLGLSITTPSSANVRNAYSPPDDLPFPPFASSTYTSSIRSSKEVSPSAIDPPLARESVSIERTGGVRKISDLFRRRDTQERSVPGSPAWSPRASVDTPNLDRQDLEQFLRRTTFTATYDFDPYSPYPRHPNTGRGWKSRNLKCTTCSNTDCAICHRVCCAYRAAVLALDNHGVNSPARPLALQRIQEITKLYPYGKEAPTFLQCTAETGGSKMGCGKLICPDCCGVCPDEACADTVCRRCKPKVWEACEWHKNSSMSAERADH